MRWQETATRAANARAYEVVDTAGVSDYQGWGALLLTSMDGDGWAVLAWSYGSCSYCDGYEDMTEDERHAAFCERIEPFKTEDEARSKFDERKGW